MIFEGLHFEQAKASQQASSLQQGRVQQHFDSVLHRQMMKVVPGDSAQLMCDAKDKKRKRKQGLSQEEKEGSVAKTIHAMKSHILAIKKLEAES